MDRHRLQTGRCAVPSWWRQRVSSSWLSVSGMSRNGVGERRRWALNAILTSSWLQRLNGRGRVPGSTWMIVWMDWSAVIPLIKHVGGGIISSESCILRRRGCKSLIPRAHLCGSSRGSTIVDNHRKPQIYRENRKGTAFTAIKAKTFPDLLHDNRSLPPTKIFAEPPRTTAWTAHTRESGIIFIIRLSTAAQLSMTLCHPSLFTASQHCMMFPKCTACRWTFSGGQRHFETLFAVLYW